MPDEKISCYTSEELAAMRVKGESRTDWAYVNAMTDADIDAAIASDPDAEEITEEEWNQAIFTIPLHLDRSMMTWLKTQGEDYEAFIKRLVQNAMQQNPEIHNP